MGSTVVTQAGNINQGAGTGDALVANPLSQFGATTSAQLAGVLGDETGTGAAVLATSPKLVTPTLNGQSAETIITDRHLTADTAGNNLTVQAGGATSGATDKSGGQLILKGGIATGTGSSGVTLQGYVAGSTGTADCTEQDMVKVVGNTLGLFNTTPVIKPTALTAQFTTITHTAPVTPDYAIQDLTQTVPWGFATKDEGNSVLKVIANLQTRVAELETKLTAVGLLT